MGQSFKKIHKVKFQHCDAAGIVFYPRFLEMLNELVEDWFEEELGFPFKLLHHGEGLPTAKLEIHFANPARLGDVLEKCLQVVHLGNSSLTYAFKFECNGVLILKGECTLVYVGLSNDKLKSKHWDDVVRTHIKRFFI